MVELQQSAGAPSSTKYREGHAQMKILIIEDDAQTRHFLVKGLREAGHVVDEAIDGETHRPLPDQAVIADMKKQKLKLKEEISEMEHA